MKLSHSFEELPSCTDKPMAVKPDRGQHGPPAAERVEGAAAKLQQLLDF